jgi:hypothetical protein
MSGEWVVAPTALDWRGARPAEERWHWDNASLASGEGEFVRDFCRDELILVLSTLVRD